MRRGPIKANRLSDPEDSEKKADAYGEVRSRDGSTAPDNTQ